MHFLVDPLSDRPHPYVRRAVIPQSAFLVCCVYGLAVNVLKGGVSQALPNVSGSAALVAGGRGAARQRDFLILCAPVRLRPRLLICLSGGIWLIASVLSGVMMGSNLRRTLRRRKQRFSAYFAALFKRADWPAPISAHFYGPPIQNRVPRFA